MFVRLLDKILFTAILITGLQLPQLMEQYQQYLAGYFDATRLQVENYRGNAILNGYVDIYAMIDEHLQNTISSVRTDAEQKLETLAEYDELTEGMNIFQTGNLLEKTMYMFSPQRTDMLKGTLVNFEPGIPLSVNAFFFALILAVLLNGLIASHVYLYKWRKNKKAKVLLQQKKLKAQ